LRKIVGVETGIITRENTDIVGTRAKKLKINELHMGSMEKEITLEEILKRKNLKADEIAYIGDDTNDLEIMEKVGLSACPQDATVFAKKVADVILPSNGGNGAFRDLAELIIEAKLKSVKKGIVK